MTVLASLIHPAQGDRDAAGPRQADAQNRFDSPTDKPPGRSRTVSGVFHVVVQYPTPVPKAQPAITSVCQWAWLFSRATAS